VKCLSSPPVLLDQLVSQTARQAKPAILKLPVFHSWILVFLEGTNITGTTPPPQAATGCHSPSNPQAPRGWTRPPQGATARHRRPQATKPQGPHLELQVSIWSSTRPPGPPNGHLDLQNTLELQTNTRSTKRPSGNLNGHLEL